MLFYLSIIAKMTQVIFTLWTYKYEMLKLRCMMSTLANSCIKHIRYVNLQMVMFLLFLIVPSVLFAEEFVSRDDYHCISIVKMSGLLLLNNRIYFDMCTNTRLIRNRYTGRTVRVACGKCEACIQAKAVARTNRIRNHFADGEICLFITLTYDNDCIPYVFHDDLMTDPFQLIVYRGTKEFTRIPVSNDDAELIRDYILDSCVKGSKPLPSLSRMPGKMGIIFYKDVKDFMKRLRINLKRHYSYDYPISYYSCAEYGGHSFRPHFHLLLYVRKDSFDTLRDAVCESWTYADKRRTYRFVQIARDASSYVASYVNCSASFPQIFSTHVLRQKHSYSQNFGVRLSCFSLSQILSRVEYRDMHYYRTTYKDGVPVVTSVLIPQYVIARYFPKFKGYFWLAPDSLFVLLRLPNQLRYQLLQYESLDWSDDDFRRIFVRLYHALEYYVSETGKTEYDFCIDYVRVWNCYNSSVLKDSLTGVLDESDWFDYYENANELLAFPDISPTLSCYDIESFTMDANARQDIVNKTINLKSVYYRKDKTKKVVNYALSNKGFNV